MIALLALMAALQAQASPEPEPAQCDDEGPQAVCAEPWPTVYSPADAIHLPKLAQANRDGVRFVMTPSLGGRAVLYQLTAGRNGGAELLAIWFWGHPYAGWRETDRVQAEIPTRDYRRFLRSIDAALALPDDSPQDEICIDGPVYRTQRHAAGRTASYEGGVCGPSANAVLATLFPAFLCRQFNRTELPRSFGGQCPRLLRTGREAAEGLADHGEAAP